MGAKPTLRRILGLYALYARMDLDFLLRDAGFSLLLIASDLVSTLAAVSGVFLLTWRFDGVSGLNRWEILFMLGLTTTVSGLFQLFFASNNAGYPSRRIGRGQLDHMLLQPLPLWLQFCAEGFLPFTGSQNFLAGLGLLYWAMHGLGLHPGLTWWLSLAGYLLCSLACLAGVSLLWSTLAFRWPIAFEEVSDTVVNDLCGQLSQYPLSILPLALQWPLISVIPAGLLAWFPACALLGLPPLGLPALFPLFLALALWALALFAFRKGFGYYVKSGSNRYYSGGFRN
ncbi:MAG: ABC transporter permease [Christensenellaceae bacterium]|jgi:ABC-2 type transport system permease protein|nr:ABC transporter permease [Christensenellaceae bacterium]